MNSKRFRWANFAAAFSLVAVAALLAAPTPAPAAGYKLHPSGFGAHSYSAWRAHQGLVDSTGNDYQALYFQKMTATSTNAAGVSVIKGFEGLRADQLTGLQWDHRTDGHCGAGAPRWNVNLRDAMGNNYTVFLGCFAAPQHSPGGTGPGNHTWCTDRYPGSAIDTQILAQTGQLASNLTVRNLAIVFDEGNEPTNFVPQPPGCPPGPSQVGFIYLDNITVEANGTAHVWTGASDNGDGETITSSSVPLEELLGGPLSMLFP
jgi:hypothetical protein